MTHIPQESKEPVDGNLVDFIIPLLIADEETIISDYLGQLHSAEIANLLSALPREYRQHLWKLLPIGLEGETLSYLGEEVRNGIIGKMEDADVIAVAETMNIDGLADVVDGLPDRISDEIIESLDDDRRQRLEVSLSYLEGTAGRLMSTDVISVRVNVTIAVVLRYLRYLKPLPPHTDALMVTNEHGDFLGKLKLDVIVSEHPSSLVGDIMQEDAVTVTDATNEHDVTQLFEQRGLLSIPVIDEVGKLLGRITVDNVVGVIVAEADKALLASGGLSEDEDLFAAILPSAKRRGIWLGINLVTVFMAAWIIGRFEEALDKIVALAVLMPIVASMGGIAGSQTLTLTIRGLALGQISNTNLRWLGNKELAVGFLNGCAWAVVVAIVTFAWFQDIGIALIIAAAMMLNLVAASLSGVLIPVILSRRGIDPALSGAVILTTITDIVGFLSFLGLATIFLL